MDHVVLRGPDRSHTEADIIVVCELYWLIFWCIYNESACNKILKKKLPLQKLQKLYNQHLTLLCKPHTQLVKLTLEASNRAKYCCPKGSWRP